MPFIPGQATTLALFGAMEVTTHNSADHHNLARALPIMLYVPIFIIYFSVIQLQFLKYMCTVHSKSIGRNFRCSIRAQRARSSYSLIHTPNYHICIYQKVKSHERPYLPQCLLHSEGYGQSNVMGRGEPVYMAAGHRRVLQSEPV